MRKMPKSFSHKGISIFLAVFVLLSDQLSKWIIVRWLMLNDIVYISPFFNIVRVENKGITFGMLNKLASPIILIIISCVIIICLMVWINQQRQYYILPAFLIIGGAIGNIIDRIIHGAVIDFLDFHLGEYHWPAFNIADSSIVIGTFVLFFITCGEES